MAAVDGLLKMVAQNSADELRLKTDAAPQIFSRNAPIRLSIPPTPEMMMRHLLEGVLTAAVEAELSARGKSDTAYATKDGEAYTAHFAGRAGESLEVIFRRTKAAATATVSAPARTLASSPPVRAIVPAVATDATALTRLCHRAAEMRASDLHLISGEPISLRIDGSLRTLEGGPAPALESLFADFVTAAEFAVLHQRSKDFAFELAELGRFRVNIYRVSGRVAAAIRLLPSTTPSLASLNLHSQLGDLTELRDGLVLVCGPTGAGKSATLAALAQAALERRSGVLITLEDPVEYFIAPPNASTIVRQRHIGIDVANFAAGLRDALRENPDIILVGEMRDPETISLALTAAETGHLVFASLHSRSAAGTIERIIDSYRAEQQQQVRVQLAESLRAVISQRLVVRKTGAGRLPAVELMRGNYTVANLIREGKTAQLTTVLQSGKKEGMMPLERNLADLVATGQVALADAKAAANSIDMLNTYLAS